MKLLCSTLTMFIISSIRVKPSTIFSYIDQINPINVQRFYMQDPEDCMQQCYLPDKLKQPQPGREVL
ncbi:hypothetical protein VNO80_09862 [Phaseolus coccineus]|uniref:Uncharacterized protein n=1 Tax=Phaseolus coccineus TaxID=3886 RepID=A0AAN9NCB6_PHACN